MNIGIIGAGALGSTLARLFANAGHTVAVSNGRGPHLLTHLVASIGLNAKAASPDQAIQFGDVVVIAIPFGKYKSLPARALAGKIVVDAMNFVAARDGNLADAESQEKTSSELLAEYLPESRIVKAFNTLTHQQLGHSASVPLKDRLAILIASDDVPAKQTVASLITSIGFRAVDLGTLADSARRVQDDQNISSSIIVQDAHDGYGVDH